MDIKKPPGPAEPLDSKFHFKFTLHNVIEAVQWFKNEVKQLKTPNGKTKQHKKECADKKRTFSSDAVQQVRDLCNLLWWKIILYFFYRYKIPVIHQHTKYQYDDQ